jgi:hypothetical protein
MLRAPPRPTVPPRRGGGHGTGRGLEVCSAAWAERKVVIVEESGERTIGGHVRMAHATTKGENQISEYVGRLEIEECARILATAPDALPLLAAGRSPTDDKRGF